MTLPSCDAKFLDRVRQAAEAYFNAHPDEDAITIGQLKKGEKAPDIVADPDAKRQTCVISKRTQFHILGADFFCDAGTTMDIAAVARRTGPGKNAKVLIDKAILYFSFNLKKWRGCGVNNVIGELLPNTEFTAIPHEVAKTWCAASPRHIASDKVAPLCQDPVQLTKLCAEEPEAAYARCAEEAPVQFLPAVKAALSRVRFTKMAVTVGKQVPSLFVSWVFDGRTPKEGYDSAGPFTYGLGKPMLDAIQKNPATKAVYDSLSKGISIATDLTGFLSYVFALVAGEGGTSPTSAVQR